MKQWQQPGFLWGEEDFIANTQTIGEDFRKKHYTDGFFTANDGTKLHYTFVKNEQEKAAVVISHGFCEIIAKYDETIYYLYQLGYSVYFIDHRGHGYSGRKVPEFDKVCIGSFDEYVDDFRQFMDEIVKKNSPDTTYLLFAHSMGGAIGALFLEKYPDYFKAAVLSSPMIKMRCGKMPDWLVWICIGWGHLVHWQYHYVPGQHGYDDTYDFDNSCSLSRARYDYVYKLRQVTPEYQTSSGTYGWVEAGQRASGKIMKNAGRVQIPVLLLQAGIDDLVRLDAQERFAKESGNTKLVRFPDAKHEIFNAATDTREKYYHEVFSFFEEQR
jgi:lysophospholipase